MKKYLLFAPLFLTGCEASDQILTATDATGAAVPSDAVNTAQTVAAFLPSPWSEIICGAIGAAIPAYIAVRNWQKNKNEHGAK